MPAAGLARLYQFIIAHFREFTTGANTWPSDIRSDIFAGNSKKRASEAACPTKWGSLPARPFFELLFPPPESFCLEKIQRLLGVAQHAGG
jgi:hypothetical protein